MQVEEGFRVNELAGMLRRRRSVIAVVAGAVFLLSILVAGFLPNQYGATAVILVEPQTISEALVESGLAQSELNRRLNLMAAQILSRPRLSKIIDDLELYGEESEYMTREEVIEYMRSQIQVAPIIPELEVAMGSRRDEIVIDTFSITHHSDNARIAAAVANRLANDFIEEHIRERVQRSGDTAEFVESELARLSGRIADVEAQIARVKEENAGRLPEDQGANQELLRRHLDNLSRARQSLDLAASDAAFYQQQEANAAAYGGGGTLGLQAATPAQRLEQLELELGALRARGFTDKHPDIQRARQEVQVLRGRLDQQGAQDAEEEALSPNLAVQNAALERRRAELRAEQAQTEIARLEEQVTKVEGQLAQTPRVAEQLAALEREWAFLSENYRDFSNKRLDAAVAANMERRQKGEQFRVLEAAFVPPSPDSPNRPLILLLGALLGIALGGGLAILLESIDTSFHSGRDLQTRLRIPVLASIPGVFLDADRRRIRRQRVRIGLAATAVTILVLMSAFGGYVWSNGAPDWLPFGQEEEAPPEQAAAPRS
jgi:polysaccharide chain length determinant protein (PEP-CTERM system associated)